MKAIYKFKGLIVILILTLVFSLDTYGQGKNKPKGPPSWAPAHGYRDNTRHIYFPEQKTVMVPIMLSNALVAYRLD